MGPKSSKQLKEAPQMGKKVSRDRSKRMSTEAAFDVDDRKVLEENKTISFIGLIRGKFKSQPKCIIGTGALISEDLILTVAHNVCTINKIQFKKYKEHLQSSFISSTNGLRSTANLTETQNSNQMSLDETINEFKHVEFADWLQFYPAINGKMPGFTSTIQVGARRNIQDNFCKIKQFKVHPSYILNADNKKYDLALLQLQRPTQYKQQIKIMENYINTNTQISVFGYPIDKCFRDQEGCVKVQQWGTTGKFQVNYDTGYLNYKLATKVGQSGSPIFINTENNNKQSQIFCIGIHTGGNEQLKTNIGIHFTKDKLEFIADAAQTLTRRLNVIGSIKLAELPPNTTPIKPQKIMQKPLKDYESEIAQVEEKKLQKMTKMQIYNIREAAALSLIDQDYQKAARYYEKFILAIESLSQDQMNQDDEDQYENAMINLAKSYSQQGKYVQSYQLYEKAEQKCKELFNFSVEKQSTILNNKGAVLVHLGRYEQALQLFKQSYYMRKNRYGEENLLTYSSFENMTSMKFKLGINLKECVNEYERILKYKENKFGVGSKEQLKSKTNLAFVLFELKRYMEGIDNLRFCLGKYQQLLECDSRESNKVMYAEFLKSFTSKMRELCKTQSSLVELQKAFKICQSYKLMDLSQQIQLEWQKRIDLKHP